MKIKSSLFERDFIALFVFVVAFVALIAVLISSNDHNDKLLNKPISLNDETTSASSINTYNKLLKTLNSQSNVKVTFESSRGKNKPSFKVLGIVNSKANTTYFETARENDLPNQTYYTTKFTYHKNTDRCWTKRPNSTTPNSMPTASGLGLLFEPNYYTHIEQTQSNVITLTFDPPEANGKDNFLETITIIFDPKTLNISTVKRTVKNEIGTTHWNYNYSYNKTYSLPLLTPICK